MKQLFRYLLDFQKKHFEWKLYGYLFIFLLICLIFNYSVDFEDRYIDTIRNSWLRSGGMALFQGIPFLFACLIIALVTDNKKWLNDIGFWLTLILGFSAIGIVRGHFLGGFIYHQLPKADMLLLRTPIHWVLKFLLFSVLIAPIYWLITREKSNFYGLRPARFDPKPYLILLGIAVIFIGIGSFFSDIQSYYPRYRTAQGHLFAEAHGVTEYISVFIYEFTYGLSFVTVELMFRGFLIYGFTKYLGPHVVLPMVATYCVAHFGKPATEAISSIFGGYILGIVALKNRNIWGGVIIHVGVAWSMELFGYLQSQ